MESELLSRFLKAVDGLNFKFPGKKISEKTGYSPSTVSEYLSGRKELSEQFVKKFCEEFNLNFDEIYLGQKIIIKKDWKIEAEIIELKAYKMAFMYHLAKLMEQADPRKGIEDYREEIENHRKFFEKDLLKNVQ